MATAEPKGVPPVEDLDWCEALTKRHSKSFHFAFRFLPRDRARAVWATYAFCRLFDDAVDDPADPEDFDLLRLQWSRFRDGDTPGTHMWRALRWAFGRFGMTAAPFDDLIRGLDSDRTFVQPEDDAALDRYCHLVAGTVGLMLLPVLASSAPRGSLDLPAARLGQAMQLTNILRDVGEDRARGRIYLPKQAMAEFGVDGATLAAGKPDAAFVALWERYARHAEDLYAESLRYVDAYDGVARRPLRMAARIYRAILGEVRRHGHDCLTRRNRVSPGRKLAIMIGGWFG
jgi:phytoene synthase